MDFALVGGVTAPAEQQKQRIAICNKCPFKVMAKPTPYLPKVPSCNLCGCMLATKTKYLKIPRHRDNIDKELTVSELIELQTAPLSTKDDYILQTITCPHSPSKWEEVDANFQN